MIQKNKILVRQFLFIYFVFNTLLSYSESVVPYAPQKIVGTDKILDPSNVDTQSEVHIATAKNGWIYTAYIRANGTANAGIKVKRSKDNGQSWKNVCNVTYTNSRFISGLDLIVCGNDSASMVIYIISADHNLTIGKYTLFIKKYDGNSGALLANSYTEPISYSYPVVDVAMETDFLNPSVVSNPYSIGAVFTFRSNPYDSLVFLYSTDGGNTFNRQAVDTTDKYFGKVSIAYGKSLSQPNGKYFIAYEKKDGINTQIGGIRTCHNTNYPGSAFTAPFEVDKLVGATKNVCSVPSIACQVSNFDNDSADLTTVIMLERDFNGLGSNHDVLGFVNKNSKGDYWDRFNVLTTGNAKQPNIIYDFINNSFLATYWDSATGKMPLTYKDVNFTNSNSWPNLLDQYNDATVNIEDARPHLSINPTTARTNIVWISGGISVEGVAYFDTNVSLVGIMETDALKVTLNCYPNPASSQASIVFNLQSSSPVRIEVSDVTGRLLDQMKEQNFQSGRNNIQVNVESYSDGIYFVRLITPHQTISNKLIISHH